MLSQKPKIDGTFNHNTHDRLGNWEKRYPSKINLLLAFNLLLNLFNCAIDFLGCP